MNCKGHSLCAVAAPLTLFAISLAPPAYGQSEVRFTNDLSTEAVVEVSTTSAKPLTARQRVEKELDQTVNLLVQWNGVTLRDVVEEIDLQTSVDLVVHWDDFGRGDGLDPNQLLEIRLRQTPSLRRLLDLVVRRASTLEACAWNISESGYIEIGTKEALNQSRYTRVYPVGDILIETPDFENSPQIDFESVLGSADGIIGDWIFEDEDEEDRSEREDRLKNMSPGERLAELIRSLIETDQWQVYGGEGGSIRFHEPTQSLIIDAPDYMHRQIGQP